jgi:hypothetical protein
MFCGTLGAEGDSGRESHMQGCRGCGQYAGIRGLGGDASTPKVSPVGQLAITGAMSLLMILGVVALAKR